MSNSINDFLNMKKLRSFLKGMPIKKAKKLADKIQLIIQEIEEEKKSEKQNKQKRKELLNKYKDLIKNENLSPDEIAKLLGNKERKPRKNKPRPPKYRYTDADGNEKTWTGQGRTPKELQGQNLDEFLIPENELSNYLKEEVSEHQVEDQAEDQE